MPVKPSSSPWVHVSNAYVHQPTMHQRAINRLERWVRTPAAHQDQPVSPNGKHEIAPNVDNTELVSWGASGVPHYLQNPGGYGFCDAWQSGFPDSEIYDTVWKTIRQEAEKDASSEPLLSSFLYASILAHKSFEQALAFVLANRLANPTMLPTQLFEIFLEVLKCSPTVLKASVADVEAVRERDPACTSYSCALLYYKGFHALQVHRISHALWKQGQTVLALTLQSSVSEAFSVDIHPAAQIAPGVLLDHGTGAVIGETAVIGPNCSILQNVTLGGTGKEIGDRHPKIGANVLIGASATILGNILVGDGSQVAAGSLVLKPVPPRMMVAGSPAKVIGKVVGNPAMRMEHWSRVAGSIEDLWQTKDVNSKGITVNSSQDMLKIDQEPDKESFEVRVPDINDSSIQPSAQEASPADKQDIKKKQFAEDAILAAAPPDGSDDSSDSGQESDPEYSI